MLTKQKLYFLQVDAGAVDPLEPEPPVFRGPGAGAVTVNVNVAAGNGKKRYYYGIFMIDFYKIYRMSAFKGISRNARLLKQC